MQTAEESIDEIVQYSESSATEEIGHERKSTNNIERFVVVLSEWLCNERDNGNKRAARYRENVRKTGRHASFAQPFVLCSSLQISKLELDIQRLNQTLEKQKLSDMQLRSQLSDLKNLRKDFDDLRIEHVALQAK
jgi:hypothetical protein